MGVHQGKDRVPTRKTDLFLKRQERAGFLLVRMGGAKEVREKLKTYEDEK